MRFKATILRIIRYVCLCFFASTIGVVFIYKWVPVPLTPLMLIRCGQQFASQKKLSIKHMWKPMDEISEYLPIAVIASEDQRFMEHHGFDFEEIENAVKEQLSGKRKRGGSTISQQTAKNVFLWPSSTWVRKGFEAYFTVLIELLWSKERIMEVYLNSIEMGDGIYGAEAVAQLHFGTSAASLSRSQCALIAASLPNPLRFNSAAPSTYMNRRKRAILKEMNYISTRGLSRF